MDSHTFKTTTSPTIWNKHYAKGLVRWQSSGVSNITQDFLHSYARGQKLLEIGCGNGADAQTLVSHGYQYIGIDISENAITQARAHRIPEAIFTVSDIHAYTPKDLFNIVYDKGVFHNLAGPVARQAFAQKVASMLSPQGIWISICGSADNYNPNHPHGAVFLQHIVTPIEQYFEILEVRLNGKYVMLPRQNFRE